MFASIIIPTYNRDRYLKQCVLSLTQQSFYTDEYEILIIDNGSTDNTKSVSEQLIQSCSKHQIRYVYEPEPGLLSGRHRGALESKGEICIFVDDDIEASVDWLAAINEGFQDRNVQLIGGRNLPKYESEPPEWLKWFWMEHPLGKFCCELSLLDFGGEVRKIDANYVWGLNFSIRRQALFDLGGFHPDCIPKYLQHFQGDGETGLTRKANEQKLNSIYHPHALVFHRVPASRMTYEYFEQRYFYQGVSSSYTHVRKVGYSYLDEFHGYLEQYPVLRHLKDIIKTTLGQLKDQKSTLRNSTDSGEQILKSRFNHFYHEGVKFHRGAIRQNPKLLDWIVKPDYWDYKLPKY